MTSFDALHPFTILDFLVEVRLPDLAAKSDVVRDFYKPLLDDPVSAIRDARSHIATWVIELYEAGNLYDEERYHAFFLSPVYSMFSQTSLLNCLSLFLFQHSVPT